jgi:V8-like Glu-specific endopeptidase
VQIASNNLYPHIFLALHNLPSKATMVSTKCLAFLAASASAFWFPANINERQSESICGTDQSQAAVCVKDVEPIKYTLSQSVARLNMGGGLCTGWLFGSEGHLVTNNHCIDDQTTANNVIVEMGAECNSCDDRNIKQRLGCPGTIISKSAKLVYTDKDLDVTMVQLNLEPGVNLTKYGYLQAREAPVVENETVYILGHPRGFPKRVSWSTDAGLDAVVISASVTGCSVDNLSYNVDTEPGNSGSPILSGKDNLVIGLHNCGGCQLDNSGANTGNKIENIVKALMAKNLLPKDAVKGAC